MDRARYDDYLACFNRRDYAAVLAFWADDFEIVFAGYRLRGREQMLAFYRFFHRYVAESVHPSAFISDDRLLVIEASVRLEAVQTLTPEVAAAHGFGRLFCLPQGQVVEIPQFIHYHLDAQGRFTKAWCAVFELPQA